MCNNYGIFGNGCEKTFASLANVQYYNVLFYTDFDLFRFSLILGVLK